jgi:hypothetical protein
MKHLDNVHGIKTKITNVLTSAENMFFWQDMSTVSTGSTNIHILQRVFKLLSAKNPLPPRLFMVMDSAGTNKNRAFYSYLSTLCHLGIFAEIQVMFLPVGHTHWLNDQLFSVISKRFSRSNVPIESPRAMEDYLRYGIKAKSRHPAQNYVKHIDRIPDYSSWFEKLIAPNTKTNLRVWGVNRWQFRACLHPDTGAVQVQINCFGASLTTDEILITYWMGDSHGAFGQECMRRFYTGFRFSSDIVRRLYRDFSSKLNQPVDKIFFAGLPADMTQLVRRPEAMCNWTHFTMPDIDQVDAVLRCVSMIYSFIFV